jgi:phage tail sheath gpL-like
MSSIALAVQPTQRSPGLGLVYNFLAYPQSAGDTLLKALIIAWKDSYGSGLTPDTGILEGVSGPSQVSAVCGPGTPGHLASKGLFTENPNAVVDIVLAVAPSGASATATLTFLDGTSADGGSPITANQTLNFWFCGRLITVQWLVGQGKVTAATNFVAAFDADDADLPFSASNGSGTLNVVTLTAKTPGTWGNDCYAYLQVTGGSGGNVTLTTTSTTLTSVQNGVALPQATLTPTTTAGFPTSGSLYIPALNETVTYTGIQQGVNTATVAVGSNAVNVSTFAGAGTLNVSSTASYPTAGSLYIAAGPAAGTTITYTGTTSTTFTGCTTLNAGAGVLATGNAISGILFTGVTGGTGNLLTSMALQATGPSTGNKCTGGTTEINITNALSVLTAEYDFIVLCSSNTDMELASSSSNFFRLKSYIASHSAGTSAQLQQMVVADTNGLSAQIAMTSYVDFAQACLVVSRNSQSLACEFAGAELGARMRERQAFSIKNRIGMRYLYNLYPSFNLNADAYDAADEENALQHGLTPVLWDKTQTPYPARPITTYFEDINDNPDDRILDVTRVDGLYDVGKDLRTYIPETFQGLSLSPDLPAGDDELPPNVVEIGTIRQFLVQRLRVWQDKGVLRKDLLDLAVGTPQSPGTLVCQIDDVDDTQVDMLLPLAVIPVLSKFSVVIDQSA